MKVKLVYFYEWLDWLGAFKIVAVFFQRQEREIAEFTLIPITIGMRNLFILILCAENLAPDRITLVIILNVPDWFLIIAKFSNW